MLKIPSIRINPLKRPPWTPPNRLPQELFTSDDARIGHTVIEFLQDDTAILDGQLADALGIPMGELEDFENGSRILSRSAALDLAKMCLRLREGEAKRLADQIQEWEG